MPFRRSSIAGVLMDPLYIKFLRSFHSVILFVCCGLLLQHSDPIFAIESDGHAHVSRTGSVVDKEELALVVGEAVEGAMPPAPSIYYRDKDALIALKDMLAKENPFISSILYDWVKEDADMCKWTRVGCDDSQNVTFLDLKRLNLQGAVPSFSSLPSLRRLALSFNNFSGAIPPDLSLCTNLETLDISFNSLTSGIPLELGQLRNLTQLDLSSNQLRGQVDLAIFQNWTSLFYLNLSNNELFGQLPLATSWSLRLVDLSHNMFNGSLPVDTALGNAMPNLQGLRLLRNNLWGEIPPRLFNSCSPSLQELDLSWNSFWGSIPSSVGNCSSLKVLSFSRNYLSGYVPGEIGSLFQLESLILGDNNLSAIAQELGSLTKLTYLDLKRNIFSGKIPDFIFQLTALQYLWLNSNNFSGTIPPELFQTLTTIRYVDLSNNALVGDLPQTLWNLTSLRALLMARNALTGSIPEEIGNLEGLQVLDLSFNSLNGSLPSSIGKLKKLLWLMISNNSLTGPLPNDIANCSSLLWLNAAHNRLSGPLPDRIGDIGNGAEITFSENGANNSPLPDNAGDCSFIERWLPTDDGFNYNIQYSIMDYGACAAMWNNFLGGRLVLGGSSCLTQLNFTTSAYLQLSNNEIVGSIPKSLASFTRLSFLLLGDNNLTGNITQTLGTLPLLILNLSSNQLDGSISPLLGNLTCLSVLDMSSNNISGEVPMELENLGQLYSFNVSFNPELEGPIPKGGRFPGFQLSSYLGDVKLCFADGVIRQEIEAAPRTCPNNTLKLNTEPVETRESSYQHKISKPLDKYMTGGVVAGLAVAGLVVVIGAVGMWANFTTFRQKQGPASRRAGSSELDSLMAYHKHAISEKWHVEMYDGRRRGWLSYADLDWATCNFNDKKLAGKGSHAEVYKANLGGGVVLAVKLIEFHSGNKDDFLSHVRHIASLHHPNLLPVIGYFSRGPQHLLLSPFMQRGSLQDLLRDSPSVIDWQRTLSIAHGVASALAYLHDDCKPQNTIVHGSVKPSNILLDGLFKPYLADTALDRAVPVGVQPWQAPVQSYYAAPEHAPALEPAPEGDVYSFGLVLLELATRKTHQETAYGLVKRARRVAMGERSYDRDDGGLIDSIVRRTCADVRLLFRFLRVGLLCTHDDASCRPSMDDVAKYLSELKTEEDRSLPCIYAASA